MNIQKIFAGPRVKKIRNSIGLSQIAMANELDISPSYLNLIERNPCWVNFNDLHVVIVCRCSFFGFCQTCPWIVFSKHHKLRSPFVVRGPGLFDCTPRINKFVDFVAQNLDQQGVCGFAPCAFCSAATETAYGPLGALQERSVGPAATETNRQTDKQTDRQTDRQFMKAGGSDGRCRLFA